MAIPKLLILVVIIGAGLWLVSSLLGIGIFATSTILYVALILTIAQKAKWIKVLPIPQKYESMAIIAVAAVLFFTGGLAVISPILTPSAIMASFTGAAVITDEVGVTAGACAAAVSPEIRGLSATPILNAYDKESNTPYSAKVDATAYIYQNGVFVNTRGTVGGSLTGFSVGDAISLYGGNSTSSASTIGAGFYYLDPKEGICIDRQSMPIELDAHQFASPSQMQISCYDETGSVALSAGTNTSQSNYGITIGADGEKTFYCKFELNAANRAFNFKGIGMIYENDIEDCYPTDNQGLTAKVLPKFMKGKNVLVDIGTGETAISNITGWDSYWELASPIMLSEWMFVKYKFIFDAGSTDPANNEDPSASDICALVFVDANFNRGEDGNPHQDVAFTQDTAQSNIGIQENVTDAMGKQTTALIEGL